MKRYTAQYDNGKKEKEFESDNLSEVKQWMQRRLARDGDPVYAAIHDHDLDKTIYQETNEQ